MSRFDVEAVVDFAAAMAEATYAQGDPREPRRQSRSERPARSSRRLCRRAAPVIGANGQSGLDELPLERMVLETHANGRHEYRTWRADTPETRGRGLMYVSALADDQAMIFVYEEPQVVRMWMKNTYIPLDMPSSTRGGAS